MFGNYSQYNPNSWPAPEAKRKEATKQQQPNI
jgi:hypothetical protein